MSSNSRLATLRKFELALSSHTYLASLFDLDARDWSTALSSRNASFLAFRRQIPLTESAALVVIGAMVDPFKFKPTVISALGRLYAASTETDPSVRLSAILNFADFEAGKISASIKFSALPDDFDVLCSAVFPNHNMLNQFNPDLPILPLGDLSSLIDRANLALESLKVLLSDASFASLVVAYRRLAQTRSFKADPHDTLISTSDGATFDNSPGGFVSASAHSLDLIGALPEYVTLASIIPQKDS
ncbi:hypothetical protein HY990_01025 [Candidatus Micrarchaeota archaeon]|nr:hypothetical protein [Candidatus Micrarchaeota archaeon]